MRSVSFRTVLIVAAVGFFALGAVTTLVRPRRPGGVSRATPVAVAATQPAIGTSQVNLLILGVNPIQGKDRVLEAAWLASFRPPGKELFLFGFPTDYVLGDGNTLAEAFARAKDPAHALAGLTALPVDAVIQLDAAGFAAVIDFLGGVPTPDDPVDGTAALKVLALLRDDPSASLLAQARLLEALAGGAGAVQPGTDLQPLLDLVPEHAVVDVPAEQLLTMVAPYLPFEPDRIHVSLPAPRATPQP